MKKQSDQSGTVSCVSYSRPSIPREAWYLIGEHDDINSILVIGLSAAIAHTREIRGGLMKKSKDEQSCECLLAMIVMATYEDEEEYGDAIWEEFSCLCDSDLTPISAAVAFLKFARYLQPRV